jgi:dTDP-4-amino-4,6-dideoxygalactose transaminase
MPDESIPQFDTTAEVDLLWDDLNAAIQDVLHAGKFIMGEPVQALEAEIADYLGVRHAVALNSGTDALLIGLHALGIGAGDEVITPPFTFFATSEVCNLLGASAVFVDIDPATFNIDTNLIAEKITARTKALLPVHLFGNAANMDAILAVADAHGLYVLEDAAQAFGADYRGRKLGTLGHIGALSFFPTKNLGAYGDGGMLVTDDDRFAETARMLRVHGAKKKYHNERLGYNSRLDTLQAAILRVKLPHVDEWIERRRKAAAYYDERLANTPGLVTPVATPDASHTYNQYTVRILDGRRDEVRARLAAAGIHTMIYYPVPLHELPIYASAGWRFPHAERAAREVLSLPMWPYISPDQQQRVASVLIETIAQES